MFLNDQRLRTPHVPLSESKGSELVRATQMGEKPGLLFTMKLDKDRRRYIVISNGGDPVGIIDADGISDLLDWLSL